MQKATWTHAFKRAAGSGTRPFSGVNESLYSILGLERNPDESQIKAAFRQKAKALHPDASNAQHSDSEFRRVLHAYQVLRDPASRRHYDLQLDEAKPDFLRHAAGHAKQHGADTTSASDRYQWNWVRDLNLESDKPAHRHNRLDRMRADLQAEWREALLHAYLGPSVDMSTRQLPSCFEADERGHPSDPDILHVVSGRQLLAVVRECSIPFIADLAPHQTIEHFTLGVPHENNLRRSESISEDPSSLSCTKCESSGVTAPSEHLTNGSIRNVDEAKSDPARSSTASSSPTRSQHSDGSSSFTASLTVRSLELLWEDGEVGAVLTQQLHPSGELHIDVHCKGSHTWCERGNFCRTHHTLDAASEASHLAALHSSGGSTRSGTHQAVVSETPFVKQLDFIARKGVGGLKRDRLVARCKRAWLPHSSTWLFPPRCASHSIGGWYIEVASSKHRSHPAWVRPEVLVLRAAVETLMAEAEADANPPPPTLWSRMTSWCR